jgi:hypothetical protein
MEKNEFDYYGKPICQVKDLKGGEWVYDKDAKLCYVTVEQDSYTGKRSVRLHSYGIESLLQDDSFVYPLTLTTKRLADEMTKRRDIYHNANIMNPYFSEELEEEFHKLMLIDDDNDNSGEAYQSIWYSIDHLIEERLEYARKLHIRPKQ